jgi:D-alanine-D-alanine ligase
MTERLRVAVICGGRSPEHFGSVETGLYLLQHFHPGRYRVDFHYQDSEGRFLDPKGIREQFPAWMADKYIQAWDATDGKHEAVLRDALERGLDWRGDFWSLLASGAYGFIFPAMHGSFGEDGTIQGLLEMLGIPYAGCGITGSILSIDKILTKDICAAAGLEVLPYREVARGMVPEQTAAIVDRAAAELGLPLFVKPAGLGSSIGVQRVDTRDQALAAVRAALSLDGRALLEPLCRLQEYGLGLIGNHDPICSAPIAYALNPGFYSFDAKYNPDSPLDAIPAPLEPAQTERLKDFGRKVFKALGLSGCARVDCFMGGSELYLNEVNTMPGVGAHSVFPRAFKAVGLPVGEQLDRIVACGLRIHERESLLQNHFREGL